jgi:hypothetical protein
MISYSLHFGSKKHAISNKTKLSSVSKHNMREYEDKFSCPSAIDLELSKCNEILRGSNNLYQDVVDFYRDTFEKSRLEYNDRQTREDRKIFDYLQKISDDKQKNIAVECIIQLADMEYWENIELEEKKKMSEVFEKQIQYLEKNLENFKIVNAVVHYDESSPHLQLIGVPVSYNNKRGMEVQVSKNSVFSKEIMRKLQTEMREVALQDFNRVYQKKEVLKGKEKGRNYDYSIDEIKLMKEHEKVLDRDRKEVLEILSKKKKTFGVFGKEEVKLDEKEVDKILKFISTKSAIFESRKSLEILKAKEKDLEQRNIDVAGEIEKKTSDLSEKNKEIIQLENQKSQLEKNIKDKKESMNEELSQFYDEKNKILERDYNTKIFKLEENFKTKKSNLEFELENEKEVIREKIASEIREELYKELITNNAELQSLQNHLKELEKIKKNLEKEIKKLDKLRELEQMEEEKIALDKVIFEKKNEISSLDSLKLKVNKEIADLEKEKLEIKEREKALDRRESYLQKEKQMLESRENNIKVNEEKLEQKIKDLEIEREYNQKDKINIAKEKEELLTLVERYNKIEEQIASSTDKLNQLDDKKIVVTEEIRNIENKLEDRKELLLELESYRELMRISEKSSDEFSKKLQEKIIEISIEQKMSLGIEESIEKSEKTGTYEEKILLNAKIEMYENRYRDSSDENIQAKIDKFKEFKENFSFNYENVREIMQKFISNRNELILENKNLKLQLEVMKNTNTASASQLKQIDRTIKNNNNKIRVLNHAKLIVSKSTKLDNLPLRTAGAVGGYTVKNNRLLEENIDNTSKLSSFAQGWVIKLFDNEDEIDKGKGRVQGRGYER